MASFCSRQSTCSSVLKKKKKKEEEEEEATIPPHFHQVNKIFSTSLPRKVIPVLSCRLSTASTHRHLARSVSLPCPSLPFRYRWPKNGILWLGHKPLLDWKRHGFKSSRTDFVILGRL
jgi:hypothetical protein